MRSASTMIVRDYLGVTVNARQRWNAAYEERQLVPSFTDRWYDKLRPEIIARVRAAPRGLSAPSKPGGTITWKT